MASDIELRKPVYSITYELRGIETKGEFPKYFENKFLEVGLPSSKVQKIMAQNIA